MDQLFPFFFADDAQNLVAQFEEVLQVVGRLNALDLVSRQIPCHPPAVGGRAPAQTRAVLEVEHHVAANAGPDIGVRNALSPLCDHIAGRGNGDDSTQPNRVPALRRDLRRLLCAGMPAGRGAENEGHGLAVFVRAEPFVVSLRYAQIVKHLRGGLGIVFNPLPIDLGIKDAGQAESVPDLAQTEVGRLVDGGPIDSDRERAPEVGLLQEGVHVFVIRVGAEVDALLRAFRLDRVDEIKRVTGLFIEEGYVGNRAEAALPVGLPRDQLQQDDILVA